LILIADTTLPVFSNTLCETPKLKESVYYAREGDTADIYFTTSEPLNFNPDVKVNNDPAQYHELIGDEYHYQYVIDPAKVDATDNEKLANISLSGYDLAGNEGNLETASNQTSFIIDVAIPEVVKVLKDNNDEVIAEPYHFATNADLNGSIPIITTLHYKLSEDSKVTLSVHKIDNKKVEYKKEDFTQVNKITTLVSGVWQSGGVEHTVNWDGKYSNNQYGQPGKYAFIVTAQDAAGNILK